MTHARPIGIGRYLFWGVLSALAAAFAVWSIMPETVPVDVGQVARGPLDVRLMVEGQTRTKDIYVLSAPVSGQLLRVEAEPGDTVRSGETELAVLRPADPTILDKRARAEAEALAQAAADALALANAETDKVKAELAFARSELERAQKLKQSNTISQRAYDVAALNVAKLEAALKSAEATGQVRAHELETARARLIQPTGDGADASCCVAVKSPVNGQVLRVLQKSAGVVEAGAPLLEVGDAKNLEVVADLLTADAARIMEGTDVRIVNWGGAELAARVRKIEPFGYTKVSVLGIEEQRVDVVIDFVDPGQVPPTLGHGFRVVAQILQWRADDALKVPMSALFRREGGWAVFVFDDGRARLRPVDIGHMNGREGEVLSGLETGEQVILHPGDRVDDGTRVAPRAD